ncbi:MAG: hypothetical protein ACRDS0_08615 [Pseudonocardiaceae bacterium]
MTQPARWWALSPLDHQVHLLVCQDGHPASGGPHRARCGHLVPTVTPHDQPPPGTPYESCRQLFITDFTTTT